jgi:basic membrane protein A
MSAGMSRARVSRAVCFLALVVLATGCGGGRTNADKTAATPSQGPAGGVTAGLVFDIGGRGDKSFNDAAYAGLEQAKTQLGVRTDYVEPGESMDREAALRQLAAKGDDPVLGIGFMFTDDITRIAEEFPKLHFACVDYSVKPDAPIPSNLAALTFREEEGSFLVGALAALLSKTHVIGFVGGMDSPLIRKFESGYRAGAKTADPNCSVLVAYAGVTGDAFKNPTKGHELALAQYGKGADIIYHASGSTGLGVFEAAREKNKLAIGVDRDQWNDMPGHVLTSMVKGVSTVVFETVRRVKDGQFAGGVQQFGLKERGVDYVYDEHNRGMIPDAVHARVEQLRQQIIAGRIKVPTTREEFASFMPPSPVQ